MESKKESKIVSNGKTTCACGTGCTCGCGCGCGRAWRVLGWVIGLIVLLFVFGVGVKLGEIRVEFHDMYGAYVVHHDMMMQGSYGGGGGGFVPPVATPLPAEISSTTTPQ